MRRFNKIVGELILQIEKGNNMMLTKHVALDRYDVLRGQSGAIKSLLEAIKPELELMLKEQAKIVRHEAITAVQGVIPDQQIYTDVMRVITNLQHPWVDLDGEGK